MKICIIGGGPSGLFLAKFLSPDVKLITIFEKDESFGGMYKYSQNPKFDIFKKILKLENVKFIPRFEVTRENFKDIEQKFDKFVVATGAIPKYDKKSEFVNSLDIIKDKIPIKNLGNKICIIGMGNVALDVCTKIICKINETDQNKKSDLIKKSNLIKEIDICSRQNPYLSKFGNLELRELKSLSDIKAFNLINPTNEKEKRRHELLKQEKSEEVRKPKINLRFNTTVKKIIKKDGIYTVEFNTGDIKSYDSIISSFGFTPNPLKLETKKPVYKIGWAKEAFGNINNALFEAKRLALKILK